MISLRLDEFMSSKNVEASPDPNISLLTAVVIETAFCITAIVLLVSVIAPPQPSPLLLAGGVVGRPFGFNWQLLPLFASVECHHL